MIERIYIPTVRRADNQITFNNLPKELQERVVMVVEPGERHLYDYPCEYLEIPEKLVGTWTQLAEKSKREATAEEMLDMYETVDKWFDERAIGVVGLSDAGTPPASNEYEDTKDVYSYVFYDGRMLSEVINDMDICSLRIAEDVLFLYEVLSRGINTRKSTEWMYDNRSMVQKDLSDTREVWTGMFKNVEDRPVNYYQSDAHYDAMRYIQSKYPHGVKIFEKDGKMKNRKYWKKVYNPKYENTLEDFMS